MFSTQVSGIRLGALYVAPAMDRPVVSQKNDQREGIREADIYYRYRGRSERIRYQQLQRLLRERQESERDSWLSLLSKIGHVGVENVGVLNLIDGELSGRGGRLLISSDLLEKVQFIRHGRFAEINEPGEPTLRLVGDVRAIPPHSLAGVRMVRHPIVIDQREIMLNFLRQERSEAPVEYIRQACRESSPYTPIYHFARYANLGLEGLHELVSEESKRRNRLIERVEGARVTPVGTLGGTTPHALERREILAALPAGDVESLRRTDRARLFEAITHLAAREIPNALLPLLAEIVESELDAMDSPVRTTCRKAIAHLDEALSLPLLPPN